MKLLSQHIAEMQALLAANGDIAVVKTDEWGTIDATPKLVKVVTNDQGILEVQDDEYIQCLRDTLVRPWYADRNWKAGWESCLKENAGTYGTFEKFVEAQEMVIDHYQKQIADFDAAPYMINI